VGRTLAVLTVALLSALPVGAQTLADAISGCGGVPPATTINANPSNYRTLLPTLLAGQRLLLAPGTYGQGLPLTNLNGAPNQCIVIEGPAAGSPAVFTARSCCNTVSIQDSSYVAIRNLELDGQDIPVDAVKVESPSGYAHHLLLENLYIHGHGADQQIVGINTKGIAWNVVIRRCRIVAAGTGIYLGDSDGSAEFVNGLVEHNLIVDTIGYNMQIKHQNGRNTGAGIPASATTTIRHNVFSKANNASTGGNARPNLLVGHWPLSGPGSTDYYQIYGNFFFQNPVEALFQGEGNVGFYTNLLLNDSDPGVPAVAIQAQNDVPKSIEVFRNTVVAASRGIRVSGGDPGFEQRVVGNAVFAGLPIQAPFVSANIEDTYGLAATYLVNPAGAIGSTLSLFPRAGTLTGPAMSTATVLSLLEKEWDFEGRLRGAVLRGAYDAEAPALPAWPLDLAIKPEFANLALTLGDAPDPVDPGATLTYTAQVTNTGTAVVPAATLAIVLPAGVSFQSASPGCSNASGTVTCALAALLPGAPPTARTVQMGVPLSASGTLVGSGSVSGAGPLDPTPADNSAGAQTTVNPSADLALDQSDSADPVAQGAPFSYTLTVTNGGPSAATGVTLVDTLSPAVSFVSASAGCSNAAGTVSCSLGSLGSGAGATVTINVTAGNLAGAVNTASVSSAGPDPVAVNNTSYEATAFELGLAKELVHGGEYRLDLAPLPGPVAREELFRLRRPARTSWEVVVDATSADVSGPGQAIALDRLGPDLATVLGSAVPIGTGHSRSLRLPTFDYDSVDELVRVRSTGCTTSCGPEDVYRIRARETTGRIARFNNSGSQVTILLLQNTSSGPISGTVWLWSAGGVLAASQAFTLAAHQTTALNTGTLASGTSGSITVSHTGSYGALSGKAVALEAATGFTFDSVLEPRPR
jgi:uncharacterized repeat protein (TIGR01451 family)